MCTIDNPVIRRTWWQHPLIYWSFVGWVELSICWALRAGRFLRFALVGGLTVPIGMGALWIGVEVVGLHYMVANVIAIAVSTAAWFVLHSLWTFRDRETGLRAGIMGPIIRLCGVGLYTGLLVLFTEAFGLWYMISAGFAMCIQMPVTYLLASRLAWIRERARISSK